MIDFKTYVKEDEAVQAFAAIWPEKDLLNDENLPGTLNSVSDLRAKRFSGMDDQAMTNGVIDTEAERAAWPKFIAALDAEIAEYNEAVRKEKDEADADRTASEEES